MRVYLITCNGANNKRINLCITNNVAHTKNVCDMYKEKDVSYKSITDVQAVSILEKDFGCQIAIF